MQQACGENPEAEIRHRSKLFVRDSQDVIAQMQSRQTAPGGPQELCRQLRIDISQNARCDAFRDVSFEAREFVSSAINDWVGKFLRRTPANRHQC
jgi:hypothetical protein